MTGHVELSGTDPPCAERVGIGRVHTLEAALWAFFNSNNFRDGALRAVNLGADADTSGAVYGQLAGAYYGVDAIPQAWRDKLARGDEILTLASRHDLAQPERRLL